MKFVKLSFVIAAIALFALACGETTTTVNQTANTAQPTNTASANTNKATNPTTANTNAPPADELAAARTTYGQVCSACHGDKGDGGPVTIEGKKLKVPSLKEGHALNHTDEQLVRKINKGGDGMPAFADRLKPEQINDLVRFVRREFQAGANKTKEPAPAPKI
jgi:mono/diheme cytochrome c family protein